MKEDGRDASVDANDLMLTLCVNCRALQESVVVVYAPWCKFCQALENNFEALAKEMGGITVSVLPSLSHLHIFPNRQLRHVFIFLAKGHGRVSQKGMGLSVLIVVFFNGFCCRSTK
jgi:thiol-disulfide isomerase/thioredoxin